MKNDPDSFSKLAVVAQKLHGGERYILTLDIPSFSPAPSGSYYRSGDVLFLVPFAESGSIRWLIDQHRTPRGQRIYRHSF